MRAWWYLKEALFSPRTCQNLVSQATERLQPKRAVVGFGADAAVKNNIRQSTIRWIPNATPFDQIWNRMVQLFHEANNSHFGFDINLLSEVQFTEYHAEEQGYYKWHEDIDWLDTASFSHRKLSMVVQLSDPRDYEGGELQIKKNTPPQQRLRRQGTVVVFPSFLEHQVTPISKGKRYSLVAWIHGPRFR